MIDYSLVLSRLGYVDEAACCFRRALKIAPGFLGARENLDNVCSHLVERWHFRMLNDIVRNQLYQDALIKAVQQEGHRTVLDIGTGTGLLRFVISHYTKIYFKIACRNRYLCMAGLELKYWFWLQSVCTEGRGTACVCL